MSEKLTIVDVSDLEKAHGEAAYEVVEISQMDWDEERRLFTYLCPCGDRFVLTEEQIQAGEDIARCPSCSLIVKVIYEVEYESEDSVGELPADGIMAY